MDNLQDLVLYGAGGSGREIALTVEKINAVKPTFNLLGFIDDDESKVGVVMNGVQVLGGFDWIVEHKDSVACCCTFGFPKIRKTVYEKLIAAGIKLATIISPEAKVGPTVEIGEGSIIAANVSMTTNCKVGIGVFLNEGASVSHDCVVGNYVVSNPLAQISGGSTVGNEVMLGGMCFLCPKTKVGDGAVVAPLSAVYGRVKAGTHVIGKPAHRIDI